MSLQKQLDTNQMDRLKVGDMVRVEKSQTPSHPGSLLVGRVGIIIKVSAGFVHLDIAGEVWGGLMLHELAKLDSMPIGISTGLCICDFHTIILRSGCICGGS